jgi:hypothetical protein
MNGEANSANKADEAALELIKQLITLAAGVLALTATFIDKLPKGPSYMLVFLLTSWLALVISLACGLQAISAIVKSRLGNDQEWSRGAGKKYTTWCKYFFIGGIVVLAIFAFVSLSYPQVPLILKCP